MKKLRVLGLIVARKNSKGLKNKHLLKLGNKKCIEWTFDEVKKCKNLDHCVLSTDSKEIIKISKKYQLDVPFIRPAKYSKDTSSVYDVIKHAIKFLRNKKYKFDLIVLLQGSSPLRKFHHIDNSIKLFKKNINSCKTLISVSETDKKNFWILKKKINMFNLHLIKVILSEDKIIIKYIYQMVEYLYLNSKVLKIFIQIKQFSM